MQDTKLFEMALGLIPPWLVEASRFDVEGERLDITINFAAGGRFACPACGAAECPAHDTEDKSWRHLNFFQHVCYLHARVPRVRCAQCGVKTVAVPWARAGSGFTLLFEAFVMVLARQMPVAAVARLVGEHDTRLWRILQHYVDQARAARDDSQVKAVGADETRRRRGHVYVSVVVDMETHAVLYATEGKDATVLERAAADLKAHGGDPERVEELCCDMSPAFIKGAGEHFPAAQITFDKFHVMKIINEAVDQVRREERKDRPELKDSRYIWLLNPDKLKAWQADLLAWLVRPGLNLKTARAWYMRINFQEIFDAPAELAESLLRRWCTRALRSRLEPMREAVRTIRRHQDGILRWFQSRLTNGILEGINSLIQAAKAKARGYRSTRNLITMIYLIAGKLDLKLPT